MSAFSLPCVCILCVCLLRTFTCVCFLCVCIRMCIVCVSMGGGTHVQPLRSCVCILCVCIRMCLCGCALLQMCLQCTLLQMCRVVACGCALLQMCRVPTRALQGVHSSKCAEYLTLRMRNVPSTHSATVIRDRLVASDTHKDTHTHTYIIRSLTHTHTPLLQMCGVTTLGASPLLHVCVPVYAGKNTYIYGVCVCVVNTHIYGVCVCVCVRVSI